MHQLNCTLYRMSTYQQQVKQKKYDQPTHDEKLERAAALNGLLYNCTRQATTCIRKVLNVLCRSSAAERHIYIGSSKKVLLTVHKLETVYVYKLKYFVQRESWLIDMM